MRRPATAGLFYLGGPTELQLLLACKFIEVNGFEIAMDESSDEIAPILVSSCHDGSKLFGVAHRESSRDDVAFTFAALCHDPSSG